MSCCDANGTCQQGPGCACRTEVYASQKTSRALGWWLADVTSERNEYQRAADTMAMAHKIERDGLWDEVIKSKRDERERILKICYEQSLAYGKPGECMWIGIKSKVRYGDKP